MRTTSWLAVSMIFLAAPALAHEGGVDARGVVVAATADRVALRTGAGERAFDVTPRTRVVVDGHAARTGDLAAGMRAVVHARKVGDRLEARSIQAATPK